jgi:hypothetical protein
MYVKLESDELPKQAHNHENNVAICAATAKHNHDAYREGTMQRPHYGTDIHMPCFKFCTTESLQNSRADLRT